MKAIPRGVWILGFVSMLMDVSSEMIHALLPLYLTLTLGASALVVGAIEGFAEATALIVKVFSGSLSDRWRKRQPITAFGYGLAALSKPLFALATSPFLVLVARFLDRIGKGIRGAPRDALIAALAPSAIRGAAFGLRQSLDTVGAFAGPLLAMALMLAWNDDFRAVFWVAVVPAILSFLLVLFAVRDPEVAPSGDAIAQARERPRLDLRTLRSLGRPFWAVTIVGGALTLARFSEAFLILRASDVGLAAAYAPLVLVGMNIVYSVTAFPAGLLADRVAPRTLLLIGIALLVAGDVALASTRGLAGLAAGVLLWGLHMGFTQGILAAMVAQAAPSRLHGTAFGAFNFASGIAMLAASVIAGALWQLVGPGATFWAGAVLAGISALLTWSTLDSRRTR